jgi:nucleoside-diphosphate-sugar epimerase
MKVLVTGATGFIGKEIVSELLKNNFETIGIANLKSAEKSSVQKSECEILFADISDTNTFNELEKIEKIDVLIHSAGLAHQFGKTKKEEFERINVTGTKNIAELAVRLNAKHFILIGSTAIYGIKPPEKSYKNSQTIETFDENSKPNPQTFYAESKLDSEKVCREICESHNLALTIFRLAPVIGEANVGNVERLIETIKKGRFLWVGKGENLKSLIYKNDVARACVKLINKKNGATEIFNLAAPPIQMKTFVNEIAKHLDKKISNLYVPQEMLKVAFWINSKSLANKKIAKIENTIEKWLSDDVYAAAKIAEKYGFETQTSIPDAVKKQIEWNKKSP